MDGSQEARGMNYIPLVGAVSAKALAGRGRNYIEKGIYIYKRTSVMQLGSMFICNCKLSPIHNMT